MGTAEREDGRGTWHVVRNMSAEFAGVGGNVEVFKGGCQKRVREDGDEVLCAERAAVTVD